MYLYRQSCYESPFKAYSAMASDCPVLIDNGNSISCTPNETGFEVTRFDGSVSYSFQSSPILQECVVDVAQTAELTGLLTLLLIAAWGIQMLKRPIR